MKLKGIKKKKKYFTETLDDWSTSLIILLLDGI